MATHQRGRRRKQREVPRDRKGLPDTTPGDRSWPARVCIAGGAWGFTTCMTECRGPAPRRLPPSLFVRSTGLATTWPRLRRLVFPTCKTSAYDAAFSPLRYEHPHKSPEDAMRLARCPVGRSRNRCFGLKRHIHALAPTRLSRCTNVILCRMAIEEEDLDIRQHWSCVSQDEPTKVMGMSPGTGRFHHHLTMLVRGDIVGTSYRQNLYFSAIFTTYFAMPLKACADIYFGGRSAQPSSPSRWGSAG